MPICLAVKKVGGVHLLDTFEHLLHTLAPRMRQFENHENTPSMCSVLQQSFDSLMRMEVLKDGEMTSQVNHVQRKLDDVLKNQPLDSMCRMIVSSERFLDRSI